MVNHFISKHIVVTLPIIYFLEEKKRQLKQSSLNKKNKVTIVVVKEFLRNSILTTFQEKQKNVFVNMKSVSVLITSTTYILGQIT